MPTSSIPATRAGAEATSPGSRASRCGLGPSIRAGGQPPARWLLLLVPALALSCANQPDRMTHARAPTTVPRADSSYPKVIEGTDGWLYLGEELGRACRPTFGVEETVARLRRLDRLVTTSGRRFVLVVAPNKSSIVPEHLPARDAGDGCAIRRRRAFWARFHDDSPVSAVVDLATPLKRLHGTNREPVYRRLDTHWTPRGAVVYAHELAKVLDPRLWEGARVVSTGTQQRSGDLVQLLGRRDAEAVTGWAVQRPGVKGNFAVVPVGAAPVPVINTSTDAALFTPRTALLVDSFSLNQISGGAVFSFFADAVALFSEAARPQTIANEIAASQVVVAEVAERFLVAGDTALLTDDTLTAIDAALLSARRDGVSPVPATGAR
jgi:alginate O-acetyltransferase complex protein AlgJ